MSIKKAEELQVEIEAAACSGCYLLYSDAFFVVKNYVKKIVNSVLSEEFLVFNFCKFDGTVDLQFDELTNCLTTLPLMANYRVALINNLCYFELSKGCLKKLEKIAVNLPKTSILIITVSTENLDFKKSKKFKLWLDHISNFIRVFDCGFTSRVKLFEFFSDWVVKRNSGISQLNFNFLVRRLSKNWQLIFSELGKLCAYAYGREISKDDILKLTKPSIESNAFELAGAILNFEPEKALNIFKNLLSLDVSLFLILGAINACFVDLFRVCVCARNGLTDAQISEIFNYRGCEFKIKNARRFVYRFDLKKIKNCVSELLKLDLKLKSTSINKEILIEKTIVEMASRS